MTSDELGELHRLDLLLVALGPQERAEARARLLAKRIARQAANTRLE
jgi:hypothetical protein